jgi:hypothetical protein
MLMSSYGSVIGNNERKVAPPECLGRSCAASETIQILFGIGAMQLSFIDIPVDSIFAISLSKNLHNRHLVVSGR